MCRAPEYLQLMLNDRGIGGLVFLDETEISVHKHQNERLIEIFYPRSNNIAVLCTFCYTLHPEFYKDDGALHLAHQSAQVGPGLLFACIS